MADQVKLVDDVMTKAVVSVSPSTPLPNVVGIMREKNISCVVVCEESIPVGIVSERDVLRLTAALMVEETPFPALVSEVMSSPVATVVVQDSVDTIISRSRVLGVRRFPVVNEEGELIGLVTQSDLLHAHSQHLVEERKQLIHTVTERTRALEEVNENLRVQSLTDEMLQIGNRRALEFTLPRIHAVALRYHRPYAAALLDFDCFKQFNDTYGHLAADEALKKVVACVQESIRKADALFRYGGDELLLILPETPRAGAEILIRRLQESVAEIGIPHEASEHGVVTVSVGIGYCDVDGNAPESWHGVVDLSDAALYEAKRGGRNRIAFRSE